MENSQISYCGNIINVYKQGPVKIRIFSRSFVGFTVKCYVLQVVKKNVVLDLDMQDEANLDTIWLQTNEGGVRLSAEWMETGCLQFSEDCRKAR